MLTVQEVWRRALPEAVRAVAGLAGLSRAVGEVGLYPPRGAATGQARADALVIVPLDAPAAPAGQPALERLMHELVRAGAAAVIVLGEPGAEAARLAEQYTLPLFAMPAETDPRELENAIGRELSALNADLYRRGAELYRSLTEVLLQRRGLRAVIERLGGLAGRPVAFEDELPALQIWVPGPASTQNPTEEQVRAYLSKQAGELRSWGARTRLSGSDPPTLLLPFAGGRWARVVAPVVLPGTPFQLPVGWVSVFGRPDELLAIENQIAARGAATCAIELANQRAVAEAEERHRSEFLDELLAGTLSAEALQLRAEQLGVRLDEPHVAMVLRPVNAVGAGASATGPPFARVRRAADAELARLAPGSLTAERADHVLVVLAVAVDRARAQRLAESAAEGIRSRLRGVELVTGAGRAYPGVPGVRQSYREAQQALAIGEALFPSSVTHFADLGLYRLLFALPDGAELHALYEETLRPLVERDERGELLHTLETYLAVNGSATRAAEQLHLHRNTLAYRLRRIEEITGANLEDSEQRLAFQVARRARAVLRARGLT